MNESPLGTNDEYDIERGINCKRSMYVLCVHFSRYSTSAIYLKLCLAAKHITITIECDGFHIAQHAIIKCLSTKKVHQQDVHRRDIVYGCNMYESCSVHCGT